MKEEQRLMMSEEEVRERAKEILNMPREELITNHLFLQQENKSLQSQLKEKEEVTIRECELLDEMKGYLIQRIDTFKEILSKYKEIIGVSK